MVDRTAEFVPSPARPAGAAVLARHFPRVPIADTAKPVP